MCTSPFVIVLSKKMFSFTDIMSTLPNGAIILRWSIFCNKHLFINVNMNNLQTFVFRESLALGTPRPNFL